MKSKYSMDDPVNVVVRVPSKLRRKAHSLGLNMSEICRTALENEVKSREKS